MLLSVQGLARLSSDVSLKYLPSGNAVANFSIATNRRFKKQDGSKGEEVCFIEVSVFSRTAEICNQYLRKGSQIYISGKLKLDTWTDQNGVKRSKHSIVVEEMHMLGDKEDKKEPDVSVNYAPNEKYQVNIPEINITDECIPF